MSERQRRDEAGKGIVLWLRHLETEPQAAVQIKDTWASQVDGESEQRPLGRKGPEPPAVLSPWLDADQESGLPVNCRLDPNHIHIHVTLTGFCLAKFIYFTF